MTPKWHQYDTKIFINIIRIPKNLQESSTIRKNPTVTKMTLKWHQNDTKMTPNFLSIFYLWLLIWWKNQNDTKMTPKWHQNGTHFCPFLTFLPIWWKKGKCHKMTQKWHQNDIFAEKSYELLKLIELLAPNWIPWMN